MTQKGKIKKPHDIHKAQQICLVTLGLPQEPAGLDPNTLYTAIPWPLPTAASSPATFYPRGTRQAQPCFYQTSPCTLAMLLCSYRTSFSGDPVTMGGINPCFYVTHTQVIGGPGSAYSDSRRAITAPTNSTRTLSVAAGPQMDA